MSWLTTLLELTDVISVVFTPFLSSHEVVVFRPLTLSLSFSLCSPPLPPVLSSTDSSALVLRLLLIPFPATSPPPMAINSGEDDSSIPEDGGRSSSSSAGFLAGQPPLPPGHTKWPTEKSTAGDPADEKVPSLRLLLAACQDQVNLVNEKIKLLEKQKSEEFGLEHYPVRPLPPASGSN
ncbi:hypothetical protein BHE74_00051906 [Ensete ventricosum]|nr:hypothetical protein BHE74_00051906 [Ensete ventricosum]